MKNFLLALTLCTLTVPAFANPKQNKFSNDTQSSIEMSIDESGMIPDGQMLREEQPPAQPEMRLPGRIHSYFCIAADRWGHRYYGRSFLPGQARAMALSSCRHSWIRPWYFRGCHIVYCAPRFY